MLAGRIRLRLFCELEYAVLLDIGVEDRRTSARHECETSRVSGDESDIYVFHPDRRTSLLPGNIRQAIKIIN